MKKMIYTLLALAAMTSACTKSQVVDAPDINTPITFDAYSGRVPVAKATSIDNEAELAQFVVHGFTTTADASGSSYTPNYGDEYLSETVEYKDNIWGFTIKDGNDKANVYYWPADGNQLAFVAYSNNGGENVTYSDENQPSLTVKVDDDMAKQHDIMVAEFEQTKATEGSSTVALTFHHILSRIHFDAIADRNLTIYSVKINGDFIKKGTVDLTLENPAITASTEETDKVASYEVVADQANGVKVAGSKTAQDIDNTENEEDDHYLMIIPAGASEIIIEYQFNDDITQTRYIATATLGESFEFEAGKSYLYQLKLTSQTVGFTVTVNPWVEGNTDETAEEVEFVITKKTESAGSDENAGDENVGA